MLAGLVFVLVTELAFAKSFGWIREYIDAIDTVALCVIREYYSTADKPRLPGKVIFPGSLHRMDPVSQPA